MTRGQPRLLVVVSQVEKRLELSERLRGCGYDVAVAEDLPQAKREIDFKCPNFLLLEQQLSVVDEFSFCQWLRRQELPQYVYVIALTTEASDQFRCDALRAGVDAVISESIQQEELLAWLESGQRIVNLERRLSDLAKGDPLTGLPSKRTFFELFDREWKRASRFQLPLTCAMIDLDFFKRINDTYGHVVGDHVLKLVANELRANCRSTDIVARYGGEEFCILFTETEEHEAIHGAERIRNVIANLPITHKDVALRVTASFGLAGRLEDTESPSQLVDLADQALRVAKHTGRDRVVTFQTISRSGELAPNSTHGPGALFRGICARDVMTTVVAGLNQDDTVISAARFFLRFRIASAPVIDAAGKLVGILSEKDLMSIMIWRNWWTTKIRDVMRTNVVCYDEDTPVLAIYEFLCRVEIRSVVIVRDNQPKGVISRSSLLRWCSNAQESREAAATLTDPTRPTTHEDDLRVRLNATIGDLTCQADLVEESLTRETTEVVPCVIGAASRIQELANDLLAMAGAMHQQKILDPLESPTLSSNASIEPAGTASHDNGQPMNLLRSGTFPREEIPPGLVDELSQPS